MAPDRPRRQLTSRPGAGAVWSGRTAPPPLAEHPFDPATATEDEAKQWADALTDEFEFGNDHLFVAVTANDVETSTRT
ncbi:hypothetical protein GCM10022252_75450 [Streptosporangium oxazolinicum]|uniref:Uncharacterized protein n=1 Tax=Streptosporangium oxazolinicum TaxID=909287 RepID=A0ABP8BKU1_9ACTN